MNYIWAGMILLSFVCALITGRMDALTQAVIEGAEKAITLIFSMAGMMCLWSGIMNIAEKGGLTHILARLFAPVLSKLMPDYAKDHEVMQAVSANIAANLLGLGNAATPLGIEAMKRMQKNNLLKDTANNSMVVFVVLNTASVQLIPTTIAALRRAAGSQTPFDIIVPMAIVSVLALLGGIIPAVLWGKVSPNFQHRTKVKAYG
ncbi:MAG: nucleoside recognition domain-containing protein [Acutalibacteraceae bacterium]